MHWIKSVSCAIFAVRRRRNNIWEVCFRRESWQLDNSTAGETWTNLKGWWEGQWLTPGPLLLILYPVKFNQNGVGACVKNNEQKDVVKIEIGAGVKIKLEIWKREFRVRVGAAVHRSTFINVHRFIAYEKFHTTSSVMSCSVMGQECGGQSPQYSERSHLHGIVLP